MVILRGIVLWWVHVYLTFIYPRRSPIVPDCLHFCRLKSGICHRISLFHRWDELDVYLGSAPNMCNRLLRQLDPRLPTLYNNVATNVWITLLSRDEYAIGTAGPNLIPPNEGSAFRGLVIANDYYTIFVRLVNDIIDTARLVIHNSDALLIQAHLIVVDVCINIQVSGNRT